MKPRDAKTIRQIIRLKSDNFPPDSNKWGILLSDEKHVSLFGPAKLNMDYVRIPRKQFNAIIDWYNKDQKP